MYTIIWIQMLYLMVSSYMTSFVSTFLSSSIILYLCYDDTMSNLLLCSIVMSIGISIIGTPCFISMSLIHGYITYLYSKETVIVTSEPNLQIKDIEDYDDCYVDIPLDPIEITLDFK